MKEITKNRWKKFGYFWLSLTPLIGYLVITFAVSMVLTIFLTMLGVVGQQQDLYTYVMEQMMESTMLAGVIYAAIALLIFGLWYFFGCKRRQLRPPKGMLSLQNLVMIAALAFCMQYVVSYLMTLLGILLPEALQNYARMVELAGIGQVTLAGILYGVILGPMAEELVFRGVTLYYAEKCTKSFWLANMLQAALFGVMHMNLIQGIYAFVLGMLLGWIYKRFHSLYASMWFHIIFNGLAFGPMELLDEKLPKHPVFQILWGILICGAALALGIGLYRRSKVQPGKQKCKTQECQPERNHQPKERQQQEEVWQQEEE